MTSQTLRRVAPLAAGAAVLVLVAGSTYLLRDSGATPGSADLPLLRIGAGPAAADFASTKGRVIVSTTLPAGPDSARVYRFASARPDPGRLVDALGLTPRQVRTGQAVNADQGTVLRVGTGRGAPWQFARAGAYVCLDRLVGEGSGGANSTMSSVCATPQPSDQPTPSNPPSEATARDAARPVLSAVGLDADDAVIEPATTRGNALSSRTVRVDPPVDGSPATGLTTSVTVDADGVLTASGWLGEPSAFDNYPVIGARQAVDQLAAMPVPLMACPESTVPVPPGPSCGGPMEVTGATFGRSVHWEGPGERPVLVPSWLFDIKGGAEPIAIVAVDPAYLADPLSTHQGNGASGSGSGVPGSPGTADPGTAATPVAPVVEPTAMTSRFDSVASANAGGALHVTFYGGVDSCYTYDIVVKESADEVTLRLVEKRIADICIDMAQRYERTVTLAKPLGDRRVFDAAAESVLYPDRTN
ncbi:MAG: hypothetical protein ABJA93_00375 [Sporichthyaceae bacterium]